MPTKKPYCSGLPTVAFMDDPVDGKQVSAAKIGESGHYPIPPGDKFHGSTAKMLNERCGVTDAQAAAMVTGATFGWNVPGACVHDEPCAVVEDGAEDYSAGQLGWAMDEFRAVLDPDKYEVVSSGESEEGIWGREIAPDPEQGVLIRARREDRGEIGEDDYSIRVRNVGREYGGDRSFEIEVLGDFLAGESLDLRVSFSSDGDAIGATFRFAFEVLDRWNRGEN